METTKPLNPIDIFGESLPVLLSDMIQEGQKEKNRLVWLTNHLKKRYDETPSMQEYFFKYWVEKFNLHYRFYWNDRTLENLAHWYAKVEKIEGLKEWEEKYDRAKSVRIEEVLRKDFPSESFRRQLKCPLHKDKTASLKVYLNTNSWYCFGCGKGGSPIDYIMHRQGLSFKDAVDFLRYF